MRKAGCGRMRAHPLLELAQEPRLAHPGLAHQGHQVRRALAHDALVEGLERGDLAVATDQGRLLDGCLAAHGVHGRDAHRLPRQHRLGLALQVQRLELLVLHDVAGGPHRALPHGDAPGPGRALETGRHVHRVAGDGVALAHGPGQHLAGVDPHAKVEVDARREPGVHLRHRRLHAEARPHRALGVVLVRQRGAEERHHVVADVLVHRAPVARDLGAQPHQGPVHQRLHLLGVHPLGHRRVARQVGEQHGDLAALLRRLLGLRVRRRSGRRRGRAVEGVAAVHAEARLRGRRRSARGAVAREGGTAAHAEPRVGGILDAAGGAGQGAHGGKGTPAHPLA